MVTSPREQSEAEAMVGIGFDMLFTLQKYRIKSHSPAAESQCDVCIKNNDGPYDRTNRKAIVEKCTVTNVDLAQRS